MKLLWARMAILLTLAMPIVVHTGEDKPVQPAIAQRTVFLPACHACHCTPCVLARVFLFDDLCNAISYVPSLPNKAIQRLQDCCRRAKRTE